MIVNEIYLISLVQFRLIVDLLRVLIHINEEIEGGVHRLIVSALERKGLLVCTGDLHAGEVPLLDGSRAHIHVVRYGYKAGYQESDTEQYRQ